MRLTSIPAKVFVGVVAVLFVACSGTTLTASPGASAPLASAPAGSALASPTGEPIVVGSTLSLTGAFAATGIIHKIAGEEFVRRLNANGGLLGRPVEWKLLDDESTTAKVGPLYEQLISQDKVDLIIGPYATPNIIAAMAVAERQGFTMPQHTAVLAPLLKYPCQFPGWSIGPKPNEYVPNQLFDALATLPNPPKKVVIATNQNGSTDFVSHGQANGDGVGAVSIAKARGYDVTEINYPPTTTDWAPIASQIRGANPDLLLNDGLGVDLVNIVTAMKQLNYRPRLMFSLFPAPGPLVGLGADGEGILSVSIFEPNDAILSKLAPDAKTIVNDFQTAATAAKLQFPVFETQAAASWNAWEILVGGVTGAKGTDQQAICDYLHQSGAETTFNGHLTFDQASNNFWPSTQGLKQIQNGQWVMVYPADRAAGTLK